MRKISGENKKLALTSGYRSVHLVFIAEGDNVKVKVAANFIDTLFYQIYDKN